jgi:hypothetical protein
VTNVDSTRIVIPLSPVHRLELIGAHCFRIQSRSRLALLAVNAPSWAEGIFTRHRYLACAPLDPHFSGAQVNASKHKVAAVFRQLNPANCVFRACRARISGDVRPGFRNHAGPRFHGMPVQADAGAGTVPRVA